MSNELAQISEELGIKGEGLRALKQKRLNSFSEPEFKNKAWSEFREHWEKVLQGRSKFPHWNMDFDNLLIGLEIEVILLNQADEPISESDYKNILDHLAFAGYLPRTREGEIQGCSKELAEGYISLKPDFSYNLFEISLPPFKDAKKLCRILSETLDDLKNAARKADCKIHPYSYFENNSNSPINLVKDEGLLSHVALLKTNKVDPYFPSSIGSIHVHLNIFNNFDLSFLPLMYDLEILSPNLFCNCGEQGICKRGMSYERNLGGDYYLKTIPQKLHSDFQGYFDNFYNSAPLFPGEHPLPSKDLSFIRPTKYQTLEFRSACTSLKKEDHKRIINFRKIQLLYALEFKNLRPIQNSEYLKSNYLEIIGNKELYNQPISLVLKRLKILKQKYSYHWLKDVESYEKKYRKN